MNRGDGGANSGEMGDLLPEVDLGTGESAVAVSAGLSHTCAILGSGTVKCWGKFFFHVTSREALRYVTSRKAPLPLFVLCVSLVVCAGVVINVEWSELEFFVVFCFKRVYFC